MTANVSKRTAKIKPPAPKSPLKKMPIISKRPPPKVVNDKAKYVDKVGAGARSRLPRTVSGSTVTPSVASSTSSTDDAFAKLLAGSHRMNAYDFPLSQCTNVRRSHVSIQGFKGLPQFQGERDFRGCPMVDLVQAEVSRKQLEAEMRVADEHNNRLLQARQDANIRERAVLEKDFRRQQSQLNQKPLPPSKEERMRMMEHRRVTMITRNA